MKEKELIRNRESFRTAGIGRRLIARMTLIVLAWILIPTIAHAGINEIVEAVQSSEFRFTRSDSEVPFFPIGWAQYQYYPGMRFEDVDSVLPDAKVVEHSVNFGLVVPAYVAKRDMLLLGGDFALESLRVTSGPYDDQSIVRVTPVVSWLHQFGLTDTLIAFAAPIFSLDLKGDEAWGASGYAGLLGMHWINDTLQVIYGGVYENSFGQEQAYPYLGAMWDPSPKLSLALVFPYPTISYVPRDRWLLQLGMTPGGASWVGRGDGFETTQSLSSWNLDARVGYRFHGNFWLTASAGVAGLRGIEILSESDEQRFESQPGSVFGLAVQYRL